MKFSTKVLIISGVIVFSFIILFILLYVPHRQSTEYLKDFPADLQKLTTLERAQVKKNAAEIENSNRVTIAQIIGGLALLLGLYLTYLNVKTAQANLRITEEGKLTERFSKAVELLGSDSLDLRLGGIYALDRIAQDSEKDHWRVMEVLTAFIRENSHKKLISETDQTKTLPEQTNSAIFLDKKENIETVITKPREDIQAIITVIGKGDWRAREKQPLNLQGVHLYKFNLYGLDLSNANLSRANLSGVNLIVSVLKGTNLNGADLSEANLSKADLSDAKLNEANLNDAKLIEANLSKAELNEAKLVKSDLIKSNLNGAWLNKANLSKANVRGANLVDAELIAAHLSWTNLSGAYMFKAILKEANLFETDLSRADLFRADLTDIRNLTVEQLRLARNYTLAVISPELEKELYGKNKG